MSTNAWPSPMCRANTDKFIMPSVMIRVKRGLTLSFARLQVQATEEEITKIQVFQQEISKLQEENRKLKQENESLRQSLGEDSTSLDPE